VKIVILQGAFLPIPALQGGAVEKIWYSMGKEFAMRGHEVVHISKLYKDLPEEERKNNVHYIRIKGYDTPSSILKNKWLDLLYTLRAIKKIPKDADVIVTNTFWAPMALFGDKGKKIYVDVQRVPRGQMKFYTRAGRLRACSPSIYNAIIEELPLKHHRLVSFIPNPVPFKIKRLNIPKEKLILFVGRLHPEKGIDVLIRAVALLKPEIRDAWKVVIIGPYDVKEGGFGINYYKSLLVNAKNLNIDFTGPIYDPDVLIEYYAKASIFCYPVQDNSGDAAPVAPREAMAYGAVPVVSELACFHDLIIDKKNGLTFNQKATDQAYELSKKLMILLTDGLILNRLSLESSKIYEQYGPEVVAEKFLKDFNEIIL
jgi:glycosyltransferase involved in cell wall biosynthesis